MATYFWRGSTGGTASAYDWNNPKNWIEYVIVSPTVWYLRDAIKSPGENDSVTIGAALGPTALSPLLYGGFSGSDGTGGWASSIGATFASGTTMGNVLNYLSIEAIYNPEFVANRQDVQNKYPFAVIGGGKNALWELGGFGGSGATDAPGLTIGDASLDDPRYNELKLKVAFIRDLTTADLQSGALGSRLGSSGSKLINLNLVKTVNNTGSPYNVYQKGAKYSTYGGATGGASGPDQFIEWAGYIPWNGAPTSKSSVILSGHLATFQDLSRPSLAWINSGESRYGDASVLLKGCTLAFYTGTNLCPLQIDQNSTVASVNMVTPFNYVRGSLSGTPGNYPMINVLGEVNAGKAYSALGYSLTGGITSSGPGIVDLNVNNLTFVPNIPSQAPTVSIGNNYYISGSTAGSKIEKFIIQGGDNITGNVVVNIEGSVNVSEMIVHKTSIRASSNMLQTSQANFGIVDLRKNSTLLLNENPAFNNWVFGVTAGATGATSVVGGIYGDDTTTVRMSSGISLFNKQGDRAISRFNPKTGQINQTVTLNNISADQLSAIQN